MQRSPRMGETKPCESLRRWPREALASGLLRVVDSLGTAILLMDGTGRVMFANPRAAELLSTPPAELEHAPIASVLAPLEALIAAADSGVAEGRGTLRARLPSGREMHIGYTLSEVHFDPVSGTHYALAFQDITQVLRLQDERDRLLKLATVGEALPSLLHELKNPLAAIASTVELMIEDSEDEKLQTDLHAVLTEVRRTVLSLDGIGSVGRDVISARPSAVDLAVREACAILKSRAQRSGVQLWSEVETLPLLWLDPAVIRAAVFNLVANAIYACSEGGEVRVGARLSDQGRRFELTVRDDGAGMSDDVLARCTDLFFSTKRSGSGIGLALCKQIAEGAGGTLQIESELGRGTRVCISIPVPESPHARRGGARE